MKNVKVNILFFAVLVSASSSSMYGSILGCLRFRSSAGSSQGSQAVQQTETAPAAAPAPTVVTGAGAGAPRSRRSSNAAQTLAGEIVQQLLGVNSAVVTGAGAEPAEPAPGAGAPSAAVTNAESTVVPEAPRSISSSNAAQNPLPASPAAPAPAAGSVVQAQKSSMPFWIVGGLVTAYACRQQIAAGYHYLRSRFGTQNTQDAASQLLADNPAAASEQAVVVAPAQS